MFSIPNKDVYVSIQSLNDFCFLILFEHFRIDYNNVLAYIAM